MSKKLKQRLQTLQSVRPKQVDSLTKHTFIYKGKRYIQSTDGITSIEVDI